MLRNGPSWRVGNTEGMLRSTPSKAVKARMDLELRKKNWLYLDAVISHTGTPDHLIIRLEHNAVEFEKLKDVR